MPNKEGQLWNCITQIDAATASRNLYNTVNSDLINSYAWDTAIVYIQNFSGDTDYSRQTSLNTSLANTGVNNDEKCKINDMSSNIREWTTEYCTNVPSSNPTPCTSRGGDYNGNNYTGSRIQQRCYVQPRRHFLQVCTLYVVWNQKLAGRNRRSDVRSRISDVRG